MQTQPAEPSKTEADTSSILYWSAHTYDLSPYGQDDATRAHVCGQPSSVTFTVIGPSLTSKLSLTTTAARAIAAQLVEAADIVDAAASKAAA